MRVAHLGRATREDWFDLSTSIVADVAGRPAASVQAFLAANRAALMSAV